MAGYRAYMVLLCTVLVFCALGVGTASSGQHMEPAGLTPSTIISLPALDDAYVSSAAPTTNYGTDAHLLVSRTGTFAVYRNSYLRFDLSGIPAGATIISATAQLYLDGATGSGKYLVSLARVLQTWSEGSITWANRPTQAATSDTQTVSASAGYKAWPATDIVRGWLDGSFANNGIVLFHDGSTDFSLSFLSKDSSGDRPRLLVEYTLPTATATRTATRTSTPTASRTPTRTATRTFTPTPICPDTYEPNDTFATAWPITPGEYWSYLCSPSDLDYFSFAVAPGGLITLTLDNLPMDYALSLEKPAGGVVQTSNNPGTAPEQIVYTDTEGGGQYRALVHAPGANATDRQHPYRLVLGAGAPVYTPTATRTPVACGSDSAEPNDSFDTARAIVPAGTFVGLICPPGDEDFFRFTVPAGYRITANLTMLPADYDLCLYDPNGLLWPSPDIACSRNTGTTSESVALGAHMAGDYRVQVVGKGGAWHATSPYALTLALQAPTATPTRTSTPTRTGTATRTATATPPPAVTLKLWIDDALPGVEVYKLPSDLGGLASSTYVDVVVEASARSHIWPLDVVVTDVPLLFGDPIAVWRRDCSWCTADDYSSAMTRLGPGTFQVRLTLYANATTHDYVHQLVLRFALTRSVPVADYRVRAYTEATAQHQAAYSNQGRIIVTNWADKIIIANRHHLYLKNYDKAPVLRLLQSIYDMARTGMLVYYADDYHELVRNWNAYFVPYWSDETNRAADVVDDLIEDWANDGMPGAYYVAIIGDDQYIPYYRVDDPLESESDHAYGRGAHEILYHLTTNDGFFSDAKYADLDDDNWAHRPTDLAIGRIVGATPQDMQTFIQSGIIGPDVSTRHFVGASWAETNFDEEYDVQAPLRDYGFDILYDGVGESLDIIDDWNTWRRADLVQAMQQGFAAMGYCGHGEHHRITVPEQDSEERRLGIAAWEIPHISATGANLSVNHPIFGFTACRVGFSLANSWWDSMVYALAKEGASAIAAYAGISWKMDTVWGVEYDDWSEEMSQLFWLRLLESRTAGTALRRAKIGYDAGAVWDDRDEKTVRQFLLFGLPWTHLPLIHTRLGPAAASPAAPAMSPAFSPPQAAGLHATYSVTATLDASDYSIDDSTIPGYHLLQVVGLQPFYDGDRPVLPGSTLTLTLPADAVVTGITVTPANPVSLGGLNIPVVVGSIPLEGAPKGGFAATPDSLGVYPTSLYTHEIIALDGGQALVMHLLPASYDPVNDTVLLRRRLDVTVTYSAASPVILLDVRPAEMSTPADQPVHGLATVMNMGSTAVSLTPSLALYDQFDHHMGTWQGSPVNVGAGSSSALDVAAGSLVGDGTYRMVVTLRQGDSEVAHGDAFVTVVGGRLAALTGPQALAPGQSGTFTATYRNLLQTSAQVTVTIEILDGSGQVLAGQTSQTTLVAGGQFSTPMVWASDPQQRGALMVRAWAQSGGHDYGPLSLPLDIGTTLYLPVIVSNR